MQYKTPAELIEMLSSFSDKFKQKPEQYWDGIVKNSYHSKMMWENEEYIKKMKPILKKMVEVRGDDYIQKLKDSHYSKDKEKAKEVHKKIADANRQYSVELINEIYEKCWKDRSEKLYKNLAKEYDVNYHLIKNIACGRYHDDYEERLKSYQSTVAVRITQSDGTIHEFNTIKQAREWFGNEIMKSTQELVDLSPKFKKVDIKSGPYTGWKFEKLRNK